MRGMLGLVPVMRSGQRHADGRQPARGRRAGAWVAACLAVLSVLAASCSSSSSNSPTSGSSSGKVSGTVVVFAAASLKDAFDKIGAQFEKAHPGVIVKFNYAGSSSLATQIGNDAPADVFASANTMNMKTVTDGKFARGTPTIFAHNKLEIMVGAGNPKGIKTVSNLASKNIKVAVCAPDVPCGSYSKQVFDKAGVTVHPATQETSVSGVVTKVSLGEADAGVVYVTDVKAGGSKIAGVPIPPSENVTAKYPIVALKNAPNPSGATAFEKYVVSPAGQKVLGSFGFMPAGNQG
jgi:molybdate transport system substrate-binding protein